MASQPVPQQFGPDRDRQPCRLHQSEAMPSTLEEMAFARRAARAGRRTQANAVLDLDDIIVLSVEQEQRRLVGADMAFGRIERLARRVGSSPERSEEHTSELPSLMRLSYAVFCLKKKKQTQKYNSY